MMKRVGLSFGLGHASISDIHQFYTRNFDLTPNELEFVMSSISNSGYRKPFSSEQSQYLKSQQER
uniref:Uncharacterized protein n=1 Tax=Anopheles quadriannulatus TaxID=34691 RepID=A0A182X5I7_ANOQN